MKRWDDCQFHRCALIFDSMETCRVCAREFKAVTNTHLVTHGLTGSEYRARFPGAKSGKKRIIRVSMEEAVELYERQQLSINSIAKAKGVHPDTIRRDLLYWGFETRPVRQKPNSFCYDAASLERLEALALGIWMGEGTKRGNRVAVTNCDPLVLRVWLDFLLRICRVDPEKVKLRIVLHDLDRKSESERYWQMQLGMPIPCFFSGREPKPDAEPKQPMGTATLYYNSKFLMEQIQRRAVELASHP